MLHDPCEAPPLPLLIAEDLDDDYDTVAEAARVAKVTNPLVRIRTVAEGRERLANEQRYAFVLLDVNLPDGAGVDLVHALRRDPVLRTTPIVVFSTSDNPRDLRDLYQAGINAYHVKALRHRDNLAMLSSIFAYWLHSVCLDETSMSL